MSDLDTKIRIAILDSFSGPLDKLGLKLEAVGGKAKNLGDKFKFTAHLNQTAEMLERFGARARSAIETPFDAFAKFESGMKGLQAVGGFSDDAIGDLADHIKRKSKEIGASTEDIQKSFESLIAAGFDLEQSKVVSGEAFKLGRGNKLSNDAATELLVGTMQGFGLGAKDSPHVANVLAAADDVSTASAAMLGDFLSRTGSTAKASGTSLETMSAIGAVLKDAGRKDLTESATSMNNVINRLSAPSKLGGKALASVGISGKALTALRTDVTSGKLLQAIARIDKAFTDKKLTAAKRTDLIKAIFGEGGQEMSIFRDLAASLQLGDKGVTGKVEQFRTGVEGTTDRKSAILDNSAAARMEKMRAKWEAMLIDMGEKLEPAVRGIMDSIAPVIESMGKWIQQNPELAKQLGTLLVWSAGLAAVLGPVLTAVGSLISLWGGVTTMWGGITAAVAALSTAVGVATGPLLAIVGAAGLVGYAIGDLIAEFTGLDEWLGDKFFQLANKIKSWFGFETPMESAANPGLEAGGDQVMADGTVLGADGKVKSLGDGNPDLAPKKVREARASGARTVDEINAFVAKRNAGQSTAPASAPATAPAAAAPAGPNGSDRIVDAVREQTAAARRTERAVKESTDEMRRRRALPTGGGTPAGAF